MHAKILFHPMCLIDLARIGTAYDGVCLRIGSHMARYNTLPIDRGEVLLVREIDDQDILAFIIEVQS